MKDLLVILVLLFVLGVLATGAVGMLGAAGGQCSWMAAPGQNCGNWGTDQVFGK
jgi:hypothetical protein